jgi:phage terminase small subunit
VTSIPRALAYWQEVAPALIASKRLKPEQAHILGVVCEMAGQVRLLSEAVAAEGLLIEGPRGPRPNPRVRLLRDARRDLLAAALGLGSTP